jgi:hypothetical protein
MIITNDIIKEATLRPQGFIGNRIALDASNPSSNNKSLDFWYDLSGNDNKSSFNSVTLGPNGKSFMFTPNIDPTTLVGSATLSYATITDRSSVDVSGWNITVECWFKTYSMSAAEGSPLSGIDLQTQGIYGKWDSDEPFRPRNYSLIIVPTIGYWGHRSGGDWRYHEIDYSFNDSVNNWVQTIYKQDANSWSFFVDGIKVATGTDVYIFEIDSRPLSIGKRGDTQRIENSPYAFYGEIGVFNLWDRTLTDIEVVDNYNYYKQIYNG